MRLQKLKTKEDVQFDEVLRKQVKVFLQSSFYELQGTWHWEMATEALFCSDVMFSHPDGFAGTKAIFHPDDVPLLKDQLNEKEAIPYLEFRIITSYGEVRTIAGENITPVPDEEGLKAWQEKVIQVLLQEQEQKNVHVQLQLLKEISEKTSRFSEVGIWYHNKVTAYTWYADVVYQLHGLPPQSLNAYLYTFHSFIHPEDRETVTEFLDKAYKEQTPLHIDYRIVVSGSERWVSFKTQWLYSEKGEAVLGGIYQDITAQKVAEEEKETYKRLVDFQRQQLLYDEQQLNFGHWQLNLLTRKATYSEQYYRIFGVKLGTTPPFFASFLNYVHPDDRDRVEAAQRKIIYEHTADELEFRIIRADGKERHLLQSAKVLMLEGELTISGVVQDITVHRQLANKVADLQEKLLRQKWMQRQGDEAGNHIGWVMDLEENSIEWSESLYKMVNAVKAQPQNITEKTLFALTHPHDLKMFRKHWEEAVILKQPATFNFRMMQRGRVHYMKAIFSHQALNEKDYFIGTIHDITSEHELQQQLAQRTQLAESLTENILDRVIITDTNNNILLWNKASEEAYEVKKGDAVGHNFYDVFPHLKTEKEMHMFQRVLRGEKVMVEGAESALGNGYYNLYLVPLYQDAEITGVLHVINDVTKETELRHSLHDRLQLIESLVQSSVDCIIALDRNMNYLYWNKKAEEYFGLSKEAVISKNILEVFPKLVDAPAYEELRRALKGETVHLPVDVDKESYFETYLVPIKSAKGEVASILWITHDLTKEWKLQQEQRKAQDMLAEEHRRLKEAHILGGLGSFEWNTGGGTVIRWSDELYRLMGMEPQSEVITLEKMDQLIHPEDFNVLQQVKEQSLHTPGNHQHVHRMKRYDGKVLWVNHVWESITDAKGKVAKLVGIIQDITERKNAEEAILRLTDAIAEKATDKYLSLFNAIDEGFYRCEVIFDVHNKAVDIRYLEENPAAVRIMGRSIAGKSLQEIHLEYEDYWFGIWGEVAVTGESKRMQQFSEPDGKWFDFYISKVGDEDSREVVVVFQDITERKKVEQQLRDLAATLEQLVTERTIDLQESKRFAEQVMDASPDLIMVFNLLTNKYEFVSKTAYKSDKSSDNETLQIDHENILNRVHPDDRELLHQYINVFRALQDDSIHTFDYRTVQGNEVTWYRSRGKVFRRNEEGIPTHYISIVQNVTESKKAEAELQKNLAILQQAESIAAIGSWEYEIANDTFTWSEGMYRLFGLPQNIRVMPEIYLDFAVEEDRSIAKRVVKSLKKTHQPVEEILCIKRDNDIRVLRIKGSVVRNEHGKAQKVVGVDLDITDIRQAEKKLQESQHLLQQTATASPDAITIYDLQKREPIYLNDCLAEWIGTTSNELKAMGAEGRLKLLHADDRLRLLHFNEKIAASRDGDIQSLDYRVQTLKGEIKWIRNRAKAFARDAKGKVTHILSLLQDVTEEKGAEIRLKELNTSLHRKNKDLESKNEEITSFAFVGSHDLKEPLRKLHVLSDWLLMKESEQLSEKGANYLRRIADMVKLLESLLDDVLILTRMNAEDEIHARVDLNYVAQKAVEELKEEVACSGAHIHIGPLGTVVGNENHLVPLFKNFISNGIKFQKEGTVPRIAITGATVNGGEIEDDHADASKTYLCLSFGDNGIGISKQHEKKIFDVFRRLHSKEDYPGMGIGLAICKKVMEKHGGFITVSSELSRGSVFCCYFPLQQ